MGGWRWARSSVSIMHLPLPDFAKGIGCRVYSNEASENAHTDRTGERNEKMAKVEYSSILHIPTTKAPHLRLPEYLSTPLRSAYRIPIEISRQGQRACYPDRITWWRCWGMGFVERVRGLWFGRRLLAD